MKSFLTGGVELLRLNDGNCHIRCIHVILRWGGGGGFKRVNDR